MEKSDIMKKLSKIFSDLFEEEIEVFEEMTSDDIEDWDSFAHINLIEAIQQEFNIKFERADVMKMRKVGEIVMAIQEQLQ